MKILRHKRLSRVMALFFILTLLLGSTSESSVAQAPIVTQATGLDADFIPPMGKVTLGDYEANIFIPPPDNSGLPQAPATATINVGFSPDFPTGDERTAYLYAVSIWAATLDSTIPISVTADWEDLGYSPTGYTLGYGGACGYRALSIYSTWTAWFPRALADKLLGGDANPGSCDAQNTFNGNTNVPWYFGTDGNPGVGEIDFVSVVIHELGHGFGFIGSMKVDDGNAANGNECNGIAGVACWGLGSPYPFVYDCFAGDGTTKNDNLLIDTDVYANPSTSLGNALTSESVYFGGWDVTRDSGNHYPNLNVELYAPATWEPGSSYAHWDEDEFPAGDPNSLMTPVLGTQEANHNPGSLTLALFDDIGWDGTLPTDCAAQYTLTPVTVESLGASGLSLSGASKTATTPSWLPIGLGIATLLGTGVWLLIVRHRTKRAHR
ncbi:MAG: hypothetical protein JXR84_15535 [Anaerolineae bacterium]|nr:hypothetical protein [Anaerolineae bacterium]